MNTAMARTAKETNSRGGVFRQNNIAPKTVLIVPAPHKISHSVTRSAPIPLNSRNMHKNPMAITVAPQIIKSLPTFSGLPISLPRFYSNSD
jgi:hypothetical protein